MGTKSKMEIWQRKCRIQNSLLRNLLAEFVASTMLMYLGLTLEAQQILNGWASTGHVANALGWGLALVLAVQVAFNISGSHLNPAVSFNAWTFGQLPFRHFLLYSLAQTAGGYFGALLTYAVYFDKIAEFDGGVRAVVGPNATAGIFATYPGPHLSTFGAIIDQISSSAVLCFCICMITPFLIVVDLLNFGLFGL